MNWAVHMCFATCSFCNPNMKGVASEVGFATRLSFCRCRHLARLVIFCNKFFAIFLHNKCTRPCCFVYYLITHSNEVKHARLLKAKAKADVTLHTSNGYTPHAPIHVLCIKCHTQCNTPCKNVWHPCFCLVKARWELERCFRWSPLSLESEVRPNAEVARLHPRP